MVLSPTTSTGKYASMRKETIPEPSTTNTKPNKEEEQEEVLPKEAYDHLEGEQETDYDDDDELVRENIGLVRSENKVK